MPRLAGLGNGKTRTTSDDGAYNIDDSREMFAAAQESTSNSASGHGLIIPCRETERSGLVRPNADAQVRLRHCRISPVKYTVYVLQLLSVYQCGSLGRLNAWFTVFHAHISKTGLGSGQHSLSWPSGSVIVSARYD